MSIASRITAIEGHIENDYKSLQRLGADLTGVDKNIENIASVVNDIYDKLPKVTGTGSDLSLTPTLKGGMNIVLLGNAEQDTYNGYQLIPYFTTTTQGVTVSQTETGIKINGTIPSSLSYLSYELFNNSLEAGSYCINGLTGASNSTYQIVLYVDNVVKAYVTTNNKDITLTETSEVKLVLYIYRNYGTFNNLILPYMFEKGTTSHNYEPYVGGIPSPNPSYPQPIKVVTGDNSVVVQNKNWFNKNMERTYNGNASKTVLDTGVRIVDTANSSGNHYAHFTFIDLSGLEGKILRIKATVTANSNNKGRIIGRISNNTSAVGNSVFNVFDNGSYTIPNDLQDNKYFGISLYSNYNGTWESGCYVDYTNLIVTIDDEDMTYVAHQEQSYTLHLGNEYLAGIGDYKDEIVGKTDDWKIVRKVGKKDTFASGAVDGNVYYWSETNRATTESTSQVVFANKLFFNGNYINLTNAKTYMQKYQIAVNNNGSSKNVFISNSDYSTKEQYESWFTSIGLVIYYQLATSTEEPITNTTNPTLFADLNNMYDLLSYNGTTNVMTISPSGNAQMLAQVSALKGE